MADLQRLSSWKTIAVVQSGANVVLIAMLLLGAGGPQEEQKAGDTQANSERRVQDTVAARRFIICDEQNRPLGMFGAIHDGRPMFFMRPNPTSPISFIAGINKNGLPAMFMYYPNKKRGIWMGLSDTRCGVTFEAPGGEARGHVEVGVDGIRAARSSGPECTHWWWPKGGGEVRMDAEAPDSEAGAQMNVCDELKKVLGRLSRELAEPKGSKQQQ